jgi:hypothetical protein
MNNQEITDYRLLYAREDLISEEVLRFINAKKGWQPYGSPFNMGNFVGDDKYVDVLHTHVGQAMVKYK